MTEEFVTSDFTCQDDQWRTVTIVPCRPRSLKTLWEIFNGTYEPSVKVTIGDHPGRSAHLWDPQGRRSPTTSPLVNHTPLTRDTIEYGKGRFGDQTIRMGKVE